MLKVIEVEMRTALRVCIVSATAFRCHAHRQDQVWILVETYIVLGCETERMRQPGYPIVHCTHHVPCAIANLSPSLYVVCGAGVDGTGWCDDKMYF